MAFNQLENMANRSSSNIESVRCEWRLECGIGGRLKESESKLTRRAKYSTPLNVARAPIPPRVVLALKA